MIAATPAVVRVVLPAALQLLFHQCPQETEVTAATVTEAIDALDACWPGMRHRICDERPAIRRHINIYIDGVRATLPTPLRQGGEMVIVMAISGG
ncbi:MAG: MoaD/ThiS family protein [Acidiphilium sp.]|nr:MoaD/ThiS family protein [Acidiphilium sp.]MDD4936710.1 MoaD/ThiS family protein [Acidiphilium sp.]